MPESNDHGAGAVAETLARQPSFGHADVLVKER